jgi:hypothetical protein
MTKMSKSEVYSWRLSPALKADLEAAARAEKTSVSAVLEHLVRDWLRERAQVDEAEQKRMRAALLACAGTYKGDGTSATNARVREVMGEYLEAKLARRRPR